MGSSPKAPTPPDPTLTAQKQGEMNKQTAIANYGLNATNQVTPYGALSYNQIGKWEDGTPRFEATTSLSPEQQGLLNQQNEFGRQSNQLAINQIGRLSGVLSSPFKLGNEATEARLMELGRSRLDPALAMRRSQLENRLANQGINRGTEAYQSAMDELSRGENDAYNQLLLTGRGLANQEQLTERNQPISEISALIGGGQVSQPNFIGTPQSNLQPVDYMGAVNNNYLAQMKQYELDQKKNSGMWGALGSIGGTALGAALGGPMGAQLGGSLGGWAGGKF